MVTSSQGDGDQRRLGTEVPMLGSLPVPQSASTGATWLAIPVLGSPNGWQLKCLDVSVDTLGGRGYSLRRSTSLSSRPWSLCPPKSRKPIRGAQPS